ncbi:MAG: right-handed parallel beta-helix repeat-containing protein [Thermodesulfobacteriota bacterium]
MITDSGVSDAPLEPVSLRVVVVAKDGSGDYSSIQNAVDNARAGDTIQVKNGVYNEGVVFKISGTSSKPITLINYPGHSPVIDPGRGKYPSECCPSDGPLRVEFRAEWIIMEGFEIRYGWDGVKVFKPHNTIRNNWIHHNRYQGVLVISTDDIFIVGNTVEKNGTDPGACYDSAWGGESPRHCHAVYISDYSCTSASNITIRGNVLSNQGGSGVNFNGYGCSTKIQNTLIENNVIENTHYGTAMWYSVQGSMVVNNTFVIGQIPNTNATNHTFVAVWGSTGNVFKNNIFYSERSDVQAVQINDAESGQNTFDYNLWNVKSETWVWKSSWRSDFSSSYKTATGWDKNSQCCKVDPGFYSLANGIYHLKADSPARDRGQNSTCSAIDFDQEPRLEAGNACDVGMDEYL